MTEKQVKIRIGSEVYRANRRHDAGDMTQMTGNLLPRYVHISRLSIESSYDYQLHELY